MKHAFYILFLLIILGCSSGDNENEDNTKQLELTVTNFQPSYNQVKIDWAITRPSGVIINNLQIYRIEKNEVSDFYTEKQIANLPSNETSFVDEDVPYKKEVSYIIKIGYSDERIDPKFHGELKSEPKKFTRNIVTFIRVPFQVQKDHLQDNIFHILDKEGIGSLNKYNSTENKLTSTKKFSNGSLLNNKFQIVNNEIYLADTHGLISHINADTYQTIGTYSVPVKDNLNAFAVAGNRIYYQDENEWCFYDTDKNIPFTGGMASDMDYCEYLGNNNFLFLYCQFGSSLNIFGFTPESCPAFTCSPIFYNYPVGQLKPDSVDANIFTWNVDKSKFITSINGAVFNIDDLKQERRLNDITGKHYFQFAFDKNNNIYATVQGEKIVHKFNSKYELVEVIKTKLYPFFPIVTNDDLKVLGGYEPVSYWDFEYGFSFNFNVKCAIETFK